jgi:ankyrin repeat protein
MGKRLEEKAANLVRRGNRRRLRQLIGKHPYLLGCKPSVILHTAYWMNRGMLRWLLQKGMYPDSTMPGGNTVLMCAAADGDTTSMKVLLEYGATVEAKNEEGETPMGFAVAYEQPDAIHLLAVNGANIDGTESTNRTYLEWADLSGWSRAADALRSLGATERPVSMQCLCPNTSRKRNEGHPPAFNKSQRN